MESCPLLLGKSRLGMGLESCWQLPLLGAPSGDQPIWAFLLAVVAVPTRPYSRIGYTAKGEGRAGDGLTGRTPWATTLKKRGWQNGNR